MANELWVGAITGVTALGASLIGALGASRAALAQTRSAGVSAALAQQRERRRAAYREVMACVHGFMEVCWQFPDVDGTPDREVRRRRLSDMHERMGGPAGAVTRATREVLLDGPADVAVAAEQVRLAVLETQRRLGLLIDADDDGVRQDYERAYQALRDGYVAFIDSARTALQVQSRG
ncbi:hypothetical protein [Catenuloplanes indicus]|uniref:Uncharacterized protein n=1 Tax=Catenuloplanes indicus TaxID=137267 RepID=A0AAE3W7X5_9ACTN|nr:hypothetical protein [Catenuloplanes indicus]MDQ0370970.1 hypothetical protein [Catenuloplanes indicus]